MWNSCRRSEAGSRARGFPWSASRGLLCGHCGKGIFSSEILSRVYACVSNVCVRVCRVSRDLINLVLAVMLLSPP